MQSAEFSHLIARQRLGYSLEQPLYTSQEVFDVERRGWLAQQWYILGHSSELSQTGSYIVRELLGESLIIVRDEEGTARGFFNVCRHRGSRICDRDGQGRRFSCPYHSWSYRLDGTFRGAPALPEGLDVSRLSLRPVRVREIGGLIVVSLEGEAESLNAVQNALEPGLKYHGIDRARIAARRDYSISGNWKLVLENFRECYHCYPAHPEYCSVMKWVDTIAQVPSDGGTSWEQYVTKWVGEEADQESPLKTAFASDEATSAGRPLHLSNESEAGNAPYDAYRVPIGPGKQTQSKDGLPVAPLMGQLKRFDSGVSHFALRPFVGLMALNDYAVTMHFLPVEAQRTDIVMTWLVNGSARPDEVDVERMVWLWDVTTIQDKILIERNAAGVRSRSYCPGPYSKLEKATADFVAGYLREQAALAKTEDA
jgi:phenylpropionate dioxygenase-like ring-hydroxylating dioxygenase large terminal subunit